MNVQAVINNISFPKTIEELAWFVEEQGRFNVEDILYDEVMEWTMPKWAMPNDIVFFFHAKTAIQAIRRLKKELKDNEKTYFFLYDCEKLMRALERAEQLYTLYGGKIFAIGRVQERPFRDQEEYAECLHWKSRIYAQIGDIHVLEKTGRYQ